MAADGILLLADPFGITEADCIYNPVNRDVQGAGRPKRPEGGCARYR